MKTRILITIAILIIALTVITCTPAYIIKEVPAPIPEPEPVLNQEIILSNQIFTTKLCIGNQTLMFDINKILMGTLNLLVVDSLITHEQALGVITAAQDTSLRPISR